MLEAMRVFTASAIDNGKSPTIINGIVKYHATERYREAINIAMDVLGGAGIIRGPKNMIANAYMGAPVAITVEGANIMTRSLMHFGQSLIMCHPYIYQEFLALDQGNKVSFDKLFWKHIAFVITAAVRSFLSSITAGYISGNFKSDNYSCYKRKISRVSSAFAFLVEIVLLKYGGSLKTKEFLTGKLGDIVSHMYITTAVIRKMKNDAREEDSIYIKWCLNYSFQKIEESFRDIFNNLQLGVLGRVIIKAILFWNRLFPLSAGSNSNDKLTCQITDNMIGVNSSYRDGFKKDVFFTKKLESLTLYEKAYLAMKNNESLENKIKYAIKKGKLKKSKDIEQQLESAVKLMIITEEEVKSYKDSLKIIENAISVDSFELEEYSSSIMENSITTNNVDFIKKVLDFRNNIEIQEVIGNDNKKVTNKRSVKGKNSMLSKNSISC